MNSEHPPTSPLQALCEKARAQQAPPELWAAIASRVRPPATRRPWLLLASVLAGAVAWLTALHHLQPGSRSDRGTDAGLARVVSAAVPDSGHFHPEPLVEHSVLLNHLAAAPSRRSR